MATSTWSTVDKAFAWLTDNTEGWVNDPSTKTPVSAENLNAHAQAINIIDNRVVAMYAKIQEIIEALADIGIDLGTKWHLVDSVDDIDLSQKQALWKTYQIDAGDTYMFVLNGFKKTLIKKGKNKGQYKYTSLSKSKGTFLGFASALEGSAGTSIVTGMSNVIFKASAEPLSGTTVITDNDDDDDDGGGYVVWYNNKKYSGVHVNLRVYRS